MRVFFSTHRLPLIVEHVEVSAANQIPSKLTFPVKCTDICFHISVYEPLKPSLIVFPSTEVNNVRRDVWQSGKYPVAFDTVTIHLCLHDR